MVKEAPMNPRNTRQRAVPGDLIVIEARQVGGGRRLGEILEVLGETEREHYRVRWDDDHESILYPDSSDATIERRQPRADTAPVSGAAQPDYDEPVLTHEP
jgi:hypothetical protein